jgi:predicted PurR-regulated permease PerM
MPKEESNVSWASLWRIFVAVVLVAVFWLARQTILAFLLAIVLSSALDAPVTFLEKRLRFPRLLGTFLIFSAGLFGFSLLLYQILPIAVFEFASAVKYLGGANSELLREASSFLSNFRPELFVQQLSGLVNSIFQGSTTLIGAVGGVFSGLISAITFVVVSFYLTVGRDGVEKFLRSILPSPSEDYILEIYYRARGRIGRWLQAQLALSLIVGMLVFVGLSLIGVKYSLLLGVLAAIFELIPIVGPFFAGLAGVLMALSSSLTLAFWALLVFIGVQLLESNVIVPQVMRRAVNVHPVMVIFSLMAGYQVAGVIGIILAVPLAVVIQEIAESGKRRRECA